MTKRRRLIILLINRKGLGPGKKGLLLKKLLSVLLTLVFLSAMVTLASAELVLPEAVAVIGPEAFADCEHAEVLTVYHANATIAEDALEGSGIHTIRCYRGATEIIAFARRHGLQVEYLDEASAVTIWVSGSVTDVTERQVAAFKAAYPQYANVDVRILAKGEGDAVSDLADAEERADIFGFAQDQLLTLKHMDMLDPVISADAVRGRNAAGSVSASELGGTLYAYPMTADNGYFLYYDKSVVTDPTSLESILEACENAGKKFYMELTSGWYQVACFFGAGCHLEFTLSESGETFEGVQIDYASANGVKAMRSLIRIIGSNAFVDGSSAYSAENWAALVSGTWDSEAARAYLGSSFAAAKLPTVDGYQMKSFGGFKCLGVTPQPNSDKRTLCHALADWLTNESCQLERFEAAGWGPSNLAAQQSEAVQGDQVLAALAEQAGYAVPQGVLPGGYWMLASALTAEIQDGDYNQASDEAIMARLVQFENDVRALVNP